MFSEGYHGAQMLLSSLLSTVLLSVITTWWVIILRTQAIQIMVYRKAFVSFQGGVLTGISFTFWPQLGWFETIEVFPHCSSHPFPPILIKQSSLTLQKIFLCSSLTAYHLSACLHLLRRKWMALNLSRGLTSPLNVERNESQWWKVL